MQGSATGGTWRPRALPRCHEPRERVAARGDAQGTVHNFASSVLPCVPCPPNDVPPPVPQAMTCDLVSCAAVMVQSYCCGTPAATVPIQVLPSALIVWLLL